MATSTSIVKFGVTTKGMRVVLFDRYIYTLNQNRGKVKYWRCQGRTCSAFVHTDGNDNYKAHSSTHKSHLPSPERIELLDFKRKVKERVIKETTAIARIHDQELAAARLSQTLLMLAPSAGDSQPSLSRLRLQTTPALSTSRDFDIPDKYGETLAGKPFLLIDTLIRGKRMLAFANELQLVILFNLKHIFIDGTFSICPPFFDQVFTIHGVHHEYVVLCVLALLPGRSATVYKHLFQMLDENDHEGLREWLDQDCETAFYKDDEEARFICQQLMALALLPLNKVEPAFQALADNHPEPLDELFEYFETFWIETTSIDLWNVFDLKTRTNNNAEGWHNRFSYRIDKKHPNIWHFIRVLHEEEIHFNQHVQHVRMEKKKVSVQEETDRSHGQPSGSIASCCEEKNNFHQKQHNS
ncbi:unnamed protein product [Adineta ricciae]|uniref:FLYWCH-type domain-containing protein n=1 Tax=Adineta ricciae TaxID=249248 RepID=A0A815IZ39_ADIRI|nr:unnamed protein product [Adineta ricciae]